MITPDNITRKQAKRLVELLERETRCEIVARLGPLTHLECVDYAMKQIKVRNKIKRFLYGTDNLVELGEDWKILKKNKKFR